MKKFLVFAILFNMLFSAYAYSAIKQSDRYYVSESGDDNFSGLTPAKSFASLQKALITIKEQRLSTGEIKPVSIYISKGKYKYQKSILLDSLLSDISIIARKAGKVIFSGGVSINSDLKVKEKNMSDGSFMYKVDLRKAGIFDFGKIRNVGFARPYGVSWGELFINKNPMTLSRWPNKKTIPMGKVIEKGSIPRDNDFSNRGGIIEYDSARINCWAKEVDAWMAGYFMWGYADDMVKIAKIDTVKNQIFTASPTLYGFGDDKPWRQWYGVNIFAELDQNGEYYIDRETGWLYFISNQKNIKSMEFSMLETPFFLLKGAKRVDISGITFECSRGIGIAMDNTEKVIIDKCVFRNLGSLGITIGKGIEPFDDYRHEGTGKSVSGILGSLQQHYYANTTYNREGGRNNKIINCQFYNLGAGGVSIGGGDRLTLDDGNNVVENCIFHDLNRIEKSYRPAIHVTGVGNKIVHCEMYNIPSMAIYMYGNNHLIEYNYIHDVCLEIEDQGAVYYGRDPSERGTVVRYNYFENIPDKFNTCAIYNDDGACGLIVRDNVFYKAGKWNVLLGGGSDNSYFGNIFIRNKYGIHVDNRLQNWSKGLLEKGGLYEKRLKAVNYKKPPYSNYYPELLSYFENPSLPKRNVLENNVFVNVENLIDGNAEWLDNEENNRIINIENTDNSSFLFKKRSKFYRLVPEMKQIPFNKIGNY